MRFITIIVFAIISFSTPAVATHTKVISYSPGGDVGKFINRVDEAKEDKTKIIFDGQCNSACTLYLSLSKDQLCLTKNAKFGFHLPKATLSTTYSSKVERITTELMLSEYPLWVRSWIKKQGGLIRSIKTMPYSYASRFLRTCTN